MMRCRSPRLALIALLLTVCLQETGFAEPALKIGDQAFSYRKTVSHDNLWSISRQLLDKETEVTHQQLMAAMLRANPDAFLNGSVFYLRKGMVLTIPSLAEIKAEDPAKAEAFYLGQEKAWLGEEPSTPELYALGSDASATAPGANTGGKEAPGDKTLANSSGDGKGGLADAPSPSAQQDSWRAYWPYLTGIMLLIFGLWAMTRRNHQAPEAAVASSTHKQSVAVSMEGLEKTRAVEAMAVATNLVTSSGLPQQGAPLEAHETTIKLQMAKAYLELKREHAARELLEEVIQEGNPKLQDQARKLLAA